MTDTRLSLLLGFSCALTAIGLVALRPVGPSPVSPPTRSTVADPLALAAEILRRTDRFASVGMGFAGITSAQALAWRVIFQSPAADSVFNSLLIDGTRPGQLYGLAGLFLIDRPRYIHAAAQQRALGGEVATQFGCVGSWQPVSGILDQMDRGYWSREFLSGREPTVWPQ
jgi:hypothetical protein